MTGSRYVDIAVVALVACAGAACFQYHVAPCTARPLTVAEAVADSPPAARCQQPQWDPATEWETKTAHSLLWGLARSPEYVFTTVCPAGSGIDQVRVHDNLAFSVVTVATLGIWSPKRIAYTCTKREPPADDAPADDAAADDTAADDASPDDTATAAAETSP